MILLFFFITITWIIPKLGPGIKMNWSDEEKKKEKKKEEEGSCRVFGWLLVKPFRYFLLAIFVSLLYLWKGSVSFFWQSFSNFIASSENSPRLAILQLVLLKYRYPSSLSLSSYIYIYIWRSSRSAMVNALDYNTVKLNSSRAIWFTFGNILGNGMKLLSPLL